MTAGLGGMHGDLFPLPCPCDVETPPDHSLCRAVRQRVLRRIRHQESARDAVGSLNEMMSGDATFSHRPCSPSQRSVLDRVWSATDDSSLGSSVPILPKAALEALLGADSQYGDSVGSAGSLGKYVAGNVSLPKDQCSGSDLLIRMHGRANQFLENYESQMLLSSEEYAGETEKGIPPTYFDPVLKNNRAEYLKFLVELYNCGVITFRKTGRVKCTVGIFFVLKKNGKLRLILDARRCNQFFRRPPSGNNTSLSALSHLRVPRGEQMFVSQYDVKDFFFRLNIPEGLIDYFGLPEVLFEDLVEAFKGDVPAGLSSFSAGEMVSPAFSVLPMGFSWAFYLAQEALRIVVHRVLPMTQFLEDFTSPPSLARDNSIAMIYADNGNHISLSKVVANRDRSLVENELIREGLTTHEVIEATEFCVTLGGRVDGCGMTVGPTPERLYRLRAGLAQLMRGQPVTGKQLEHVVGHIISLCLLFRLSMSVLQHVYTFIHESYFTQQKLWPSVMKELRIIRGILPLCYAEINEKTCPFVYVSDACLSGYAVVRGACDSDDIFRTIQHQERWRFRHSDQVSVPARVSGLLHRDPLHDILTVCSSVPGEIPPDTIVDPHFPEIPNSLLVPADYKFMWRSPFKDKEAIHVLECRALVSTLRHISRNLKSHQSDILMLCDNMSVVLAICKGRCSDHKLLVLLRRLGAICISTGIRLCVRWIASELNFADPGSRVFEGSQKALPVRLRHLTGGPITAREFGILSPDYHGPELPEGDADADLQRGHHGEEEEGKFSAGSFERRQRKLCRGSGEAHDQEEQPAADEGWLSGHGGPSGEELGGSHAHPRCGTGDGGHQQGHRKRGLPSSAVDEEKNLQAGECKEDSKRNGNLPGGDSAGEPLCAKRHSGRLCQEAGAVLGLRGGRGPGNRRAGQSNAGGSKYGQVLQPSLGSGRAPQRGREGEGSIRVCQPRLLQRRPPRHAKGEESFEGMAQANPDAAHFRHARRRSRSACGTAARPGRRREGAVDPHSPLYLHEAFGELQTADWKHFRAHQEEQGQHAVVDHPPAAFRAAAPHQDEGLRRSHRAGRPQNALVGLGSGSPGKEKAHTLPASGPQPGSRRSAAALELQPGQHAGQLQGGRQAPGDLLAYGDSLRPQARRGVARHRSEDAQPPGSAAPRQLGAPRQPKTLRKARPPAVDHEEDGQQQPEPGQQLAATLQSCLPRLVKARGKIAGCFLSLYGGVGHVAEEGSKFGLDGVIVDYDFDSSNDLTLPSVHTDVTFSLKNKLVSIIGIEIVCSSWSIARRAPAWSSMPKPVRRTGKHIWGLPGLSKNDRALCKSGNIMVKNAIEYIELCLENGTPGYLENPRTSMVFKVPKIRRWIDDGIVQFVVGDFCQYGTQWKKPTAFLVWNCPTICLHRCKCIGGRCSMTGKKHLILTGASKSGFLTKFAQAYPRKLAKHLISQMMGAS